MLVAVAALLEQLKLGVVADGLPTQPGDPLELERDEVVAGEVADEIGCADDDRLVAVFLHRRSAGDLSRSA